MAKMAILSDKSKIEKKTFFDRRTQQATYFTKKFRKNSRSESRTSDLT